MSQYDQPSLTPGEQQTGLTTEESYDNIDPASATYQGSQKKPSILGKLKDKTRKAGSKIKSKVGKKKDADGTSATPTAGADDEEDDDDASDDSPYSPADAASPADATTPYTGPASVPREFGTYPTPETDPTPDMSGLSLGSEEAPSATEKASGVSEGAKDAMYGGAAATAGAMGYDAMSKDDEKPITEKASDMSSNVFGQDDSEEGRGGYNRAGDFADQTTGAAYDAKDTVQSKAADVNNATDDSQTYTEKASNAAFAAKDTVAAKLGLNQPSEGPSVMDKAKGYFGSATGTTQDTTGAGVDTTKDYAAGATDTTKDTMNSAADTTKDYAAGAKDTTMDTTNSAADTTKGYAATATDTVKAYAGSAYDTTASAAQSAADTTKAYAASATGAAAPKQDDKTLSEKITDTLSGLTTSATTPTGTAQDEANPGILGKLTGMLGYPQKTPGAHPASAADPTTPTSTTTNPY